MRLEGHQPNVDNPRTYIPHEPATFAKYRKIDNGARVPVSPAVRPNNYRPISFAPTGPRITRQSTHFGRDLPLPRHAAPPPRPANASVKPAVRHPHTTGDISQNNRHHTRSEIKSTVTPGRNQSFKSNAKASPEPRHTRFSTTSPKSKERTLFLSSDNSPYKPSSQMPANLLSQQPASAAGSVRSQKATRRTDTHPPHGKAYSGYRSPNSRSLDNRSGSRGTGEQHSKKDTIPSQPHPPQAPSSSAIPSTPSKLMKPSDIPTPFYATQFHLLSACFSRDSTEKKLATNVMLDKIEEELEVKYGEPLIFGHLFSSWEESDRSAVVIFRPLLTAEEKKHTLYLRWPKDCRDRWLMADLDALKQRRQAWFAGLNRRLLKLHFTFTPELTAAYLVLRPAGDSTFPGKDRIIAELGQDMVDLLKISGDLYPRATLPTASNGQSAMVSKEGPIPGLGLPAMVSSSIAQQAKGVTCAEIQGVQERRERHDTVTSNMGIDVDSGSEIETMLKGTIQLSKTPPERVGGSNTMTESEDIKPIIRPVQDPATSTKSSFRQAPSAKTTTDSRPATFPKPMRPALSASEKLSNEVGQFLKFYFAKFDSSRSFLMEFYHPNAMFSYTISTHEAHRSSAAGLLQQDADFSSAILQGSRRITNQQQMNSYPLYQTPSPIIQALKQFPPATHSASAFPWEFECWPLTADHNLSPRHAEALKTKVHIVVRGHFQEFLTSKIRSFFKSMIVEPITDASPMAAAGYGFIILNDTMTIGLPLLKPLTIPQIGVATANDEGTVMAPAHTAAISPVGAVPAFTDKRKSSMQTPRDVLVPSASSPTLSAPVTELKRDSVSPAPQGFGQRTEPAKKNTNSKSARPLPVLPAQTSTTPANGTTNGKASYAPLVLDTGGDKTRSGGSTSPNFESSSSRTSPALLSGGILQQENSFRSPSIDSTLPIAIASEDKGLPADRFKNARSSCRVELFNAVQSSVGKAKYNFIARQLVQRESDNVIVTKRGDIIATKRSNPRVAHRLYNAINHPLDVSSVIYHAPSSVLVLGLLSPTEDVANPPAEIQIVKLSEYDSKFPSIASSDRHLMATKPHAPNKGPVTASGVRSMKHLPFSHCSFVTGGDDHRIFHWQVRNTDRPRPSEVTVSEITSKHTSSVSALDYSNLNGKLISGGGDRKIHVYHFTPHGALQENSLKELAGPVAQVIVNPAAADVFGATFVRSSDQVQLFDIRDLRARAHNQSKIVLSYPGERVISSFNQGAFSPDGICFAIGDQTAVRVWDTRKASQPVSNLYLSLGDSSPVTQIVFESNSELLALQKKHLSGFTML